MQSYEQRINRVTDFIYAHLDEELDLDRLADVAAMSRWHWHRVYAGMRGETVAATVRRLRLARRPNSS
jgi:AraC family transcriptional regulator